MAISDWWGKAIVCNGKFEPYAYISRTPAALLDVSSTVVMTALAFRNLLHPTSYVVEVAIARCLKLDGGASNSCQCLCTFFTRYRLHSSSISHVWAPLVGTHYGRSSNGCDKRRGVGSALEACSLCWAPCPSFFSFPCRLPAPEEGRACSAGTAMTSEGPTPYSGNILDSPDVLWMEDRWTAEEEEEASRVVANQGPGLPRAWRDKYERETRKHWDLFYARNATNFFKDRHYLGKVFPELAETRADRELAQVLDATGEGSSGRRCGRRTLLELGCGVGNAVFPLLEENRGLFVVAVDLSSRGIELLRRHPIYGCGRCEALVLDATKDELPACVLEEGGVDLVLLQFSISAVALKDMGKVARLAERALRPGGKVLLRDYGRHDEAQLRFSKGSCLGDNVYVRQDGTTSYFFSLDDLRRLFCRGEPRQRLESDCSSSNCSSRENGASLEEEELWYVKRQYANRGQKVARRRVWVHGKFRKPLAPVGGKFPEGCP